jgi:catechol 2,3-dioxygenase-like lactoylglutathione lyase family enzyme
MLTDINPKLPMRNKAITKDFYLTKLGFREFGSADFDGYLMVQKDNIQLHFFEFKKIIPKDNYGQVYIRTDNIDNWYQLAVDKKINMPDAGHLEIKPWGQKEFSLLDPDNNLLTFGQSML